LDQLDISVLMIIVNDQENLFWVKCFGVRCLAMWVNGGVLEVSGNWGDNFGKLIRFEQLLPPSTGTHVHLER